jgi:hypothetical protein
LGLFGIDKPDWMEGTDYSGHRLNNRPPVKEPDSAFIQKDAFFEREKWLLFH